MSLEGELRERLRDFKDATPHEVFGVWPGCGRKVVQERFYVLVKEHHPDAYGAGVSDSAKRSAKEIFIIVKDTYKELLSIEKEQTVAPPADFEATARTGPEREPQGVGNAPSAASEEPAKTRQPKSVADRLGSMSAARKKRRMREQRVRKTAQSAAAASASEEVVQVGGVEDSEVIEESEANVEPEIDKAEERRAKLARLKQRSNTTTTDPGREVFYEGYKLFREKQHDQAFPMFKEAWEASPEDGLYLTFYGYTLFLLRPSEIDQAEDLLRNAITSGNRQAAPDANLFLGYIYKARGDHKKAQRHFERCKKLNPSSREAERELRLIGMRGGGEETPDDDGFLKSLFKK